MTRDLSRLSKAAGWPGAQQGPLCQIGVTLSIQRFISSFQAGAKSWRFPTFTALMEESYSGEVGGVTICFQEETSGGVPPPPPCAPDLLER